MSKAINMDGKIVDMSETIRTKFWVSDVGFLVIEQESFEYGKPVQFLISPDQAEILFSKLPALMMEQNKLWSGYVEE